MNIVLDKDQEAFLARIGLEKLIEDEKRRRQTPSLLLPKQENHWPFGDRTERAMTELKRRFGDC